MKTVLLARIESRPKYASRSTDLEVGRTLGVQGRRAFNLVRSIRLAKPHILGAIRGTDSLSRQAFRLCTSGKVLTSIPACRDAPCNETKRRYFEFERLKICQSIKISICFYFSSIIYFSRTLLTYQFRKL